MDFNFTKINVELLKSNRNKKRQLLNQLVLQILFVKILIVMENAINVTLESYSIAVNALQQAIFVEIGIKKRENALNVMMDMTSIKANAKFLNKKNNIRMLLKQFNFVKVKMLMENVLNALIEQYLLMINVFRLIVNAKLGKKMEIVQIAMKDTNSNKEIVVYQNGNLNKYHQLIKIMIFVIN